jgi:transcriptional regulator GlxA family with amidase domain
MSEAQPIPNDHMAVAIQPAVVRRRAALRLVRPTMPDSWEAEGGAAQSVVTTLPIDRPSVPASASLVKAVRSHVVEHIARPVGVMEIAAVTGVGVKAVRRAVEAEAGVRFGQFVIDIKLDAARGWLSTNRESRTLAQIAAALGFGSAKTFGRSYRKRFGESASETRRCAVRDAELSLRDLKELVL